MPGNTDQLILPRAWNADAVLFFFFYLVLRSVKNINQTIVSLQKTRK